MFKPLCWSRSHIVHYIKSQVWSSSATVGQREASFCKSHVYTYMHTHIYLYVLRSGNCGIYDYKVAMPWTYRLCRRNRSSKVRHVVGQHHPSTTILPALSCQPYPGSLQLKDTEVDVCKWLRQMMLKVLLAELAEWTSLAWATPAQSGCHCTTC